MSRHGRPLSDGVDERLQEAEDCNARDRMYTSILHDRARDQALRLDAERAVQSGRHSATFLDAAAGASAAASLATGAAHRPLFGIPVAVKDNIDMRGVPTTCGSIALALPPGAEDAPIVRRLEHAGAVIIGKTNLDEGALGASGRNEHFGRCVNPRGDGLLSGGSSSGSAAAVAAGGVRLAIGSDTLGSVRIPAALCGVVGFKPSHGALCAQGVAPLHPPYDTVGLIAGSLHDVDLAYRALGGIRDAGSPLASVDPPRILLLAESALSGVDPDVAAHYLRCCDVLRRCAQVRVSELPPVDFVALSRAALWRVAAAFAARLGFNSREFSGRCARLGEDIHRVLESATALPASKFAEGDRIIDQSRRHLLADMMEVDGLLTPTCPTRRIPSTAQLPRSLASFVVPANVTGLPAVSWPQTLAATGALRAGVARNVAAETDRLVDEDAIPASCSLQLIGRAGCDAQVIDLAGVLQTLLGGDASALRGRAAAHAASGPESTH